MDFLENNLRVLSGKSPRLADSIRNIDIPDGFVVENARSGVLTLKIDGVLLHSGYDPTLEARRLIELTDPNENSKVLLNGFGLGYLADELIGKVEKLIIAESDLSILRCAMEHRDLSEILSRALIFTGNPSIEFNLFLKDNGIQGELQVIEHNPSVKRNPAFYDALQKIEVFEAGTKHDIDVPGGLKILLPSPLYGGSLPIAYYCKNALEELGHKVDFFDSSFYYPVFQSITEVTGNEEHQAQLQGLYTMFVSEMVLAKAMESKPDMVFGIAQSPFTTETVNKFKEMKIPVAFWFMEDFRLFQYWKTFAPLYDYFFTIQKGEFSKILDELGAHHKYLPLAADPDIHKPLDLTPEEQLEFGSGLSFVGAGYYNRHHFFLQLLNEDLKIWGVEWNQSSPLGKVLQRGGERISTEDCVKIFNASKININLHSSSYHQGVNPHGDFVNPRTFEIAASGAFQLVDPRSELTGLLQDEVEIATFKDVAELRTKAKYYLDHPDEMRSMAEAGRRRVLAEHTYKHRMQEMLEYVVSHEPALQRKGDNPNIAGNLIKAAGDDAGLKDIFKRFEPDEELDIDIIADNIRGGKGRLTKEEGVFLLMKEFYDWAREKKVI